MQTVTQTPDIHARAKEMAKTAQENSQGSEIGVFCQNGTFWSKTFPDSVSGAKQAYSYGIYCLNKYPCKVTLDGSEMDINELAAFLNELEYVSRPKYFRG